MHRTKSRVRVAGVLAPCAAIAIAGCLKISEPVSKGLSIVAEPDTTPIIIAPLSITMVGGPSASPAGLAYTFTVRNTSDTVATFIAPCSGAITLRAGPDTTSSMVTLNYPVCSASVVAQPLQPGQSTSYTKVLANSYVSGGTAQGDYYAWAQLPMASGGRSGIAAAGRVHWGG